MNQHFLCQTHSEEVKYLGRDVISKKLLGFCMKCVPSAQVPLLLIEEVEKDFEQQKFLLIKFIDEEKEENIIMLTNLEEFLVQFKFQYIQKLDSLILNIKQEIINISKTSASRQESIKSFNKLDLNELNIFFQQKNIQLDLEKKKEQILTQLAEFHSNTFFFESSSILNKFPAQKQFLLSDTNDTNQGQGLKCQKHNQDVIAIDMNEQNQNEKLICLKCISDKPRQVTTIEDVNKVWNEHNSELIETYMKYQQKLKQIVSVLKSHISIYLEDIKLLSEQASIMLEKLMNQKNECIEQKIVAIKNNQLNISSQIDLQKVSDIQKNPKRIVNYVEEQLEHIEQFLKTQPFSKSKSLDLRQLFYMIDNVQKLLLDGADSEQQKFKII